MLQRIQTVYLLIIVVLTVATLFLPLAVLQQGDALFSFDASGLSRNYYTRRGAYLP